MKALIIGCGRFGVRVADYLTRNNHDVVVIDIDPETFTALGETFTGRTICGVGYDKAVLEAAGVAAADVVISCTSSDSLNAVVANTAKNVYHVPTVIARMGDPVRARLCESMGIYTELVRARVQVALVGTPVGALHIPGKFRPVAIDRAGRTLLPEDDMCFAYNDILYLAVASESLAEARDMLGL